MIPQNGRPTRQQIVQVESIPAPVGGLNARDSYAAMPPTDAVIMDNLFPSPSNIACRNGSVAWVNTFSSPVNTLACYSPPNGTRQLFAATGGAVYDVTIKGSNNPAGFSGAASDWWQHTNFSAGGGQYLVMVNGIDPMIVYNGQGWQVVGNGSGPGIIGGTSASNVATITTSTPHKLSSGNVVTLTGCVPAAYNVSNAVITVTSPTSFTYTAASPPGGPLTTLGYFSYAPSITGVLTNTFINVNVFQARLYFIVKNSMQVYFLPLMSIGGAATMLDLSSQASLGGYLVSMATWTIETTSGITEMACFITSEGEVIVYQGSDPTYASSWYKVGSFRVGRPTGYRCTCKIGSDVMIVGADGLVPLSKAMLTDRSQSEIALTDKIKNLINSDIQTYAGYMGWQPILHPFGNKVYLNVPSPDGSYQYVMNTINGSWCRFTGLNANCWEVVGDNIFFAGSFGVYQGDTGDSDNGNPIYCEAIQAPNYFGTHSEKQFTMARPILSSNGPITPAFQINTDYNFSTPTNQNNYVTAQFTPWGSPWYSPWSAVNQIYKSWLSTNSIGYSGAPAIAFSVNGAYVTWQATDVAFTPGGVI